MQPSHIGVDPSVSVPFGQRNGRVLPVLIVGSACAVTGFMMGRQYESGNSAPSPIAEAVTKNSAIKAGGIQEEADLVPKAEDANASAEVTQMKPATSHIVVLNPGTADQEGTRTQASAQVPPPPSTRPADNDVSRPHFTHKKASDNRSSKAGSPMQSYQDLRDYVLRR